MHLVSHKDIMKGLLKHPQGCTAIIKRCCCVINKLGGTSCKTHEQEHKSCQSTTHRSTAKGRPKLTLHRSRSGLQSMQDTEALRKLDGKRQAELLLLQHCYDSFLHTSSFGNCKKKFLSVSLNNALRNLIQQLYSAARKCPQQAGRCCCCLQIAASVR